MVAIVRNVPWWGVLSSAAAPVLLVGGWTIATRSQPPSSDPIDDTVSALAALGAADRWVMTLTFLLVGCCDVITGLALRPDGAWRRGPSVPWALRPAVCAGAVAVLLALLAWFGAKLVTGAGQARLAERVLGVAQAVWPLTVVLSCRHPVRQGRSRLNHMPGLYRRAGPSRSRAWHQDRYRCAPSPVPPVTVRRPYQPADLRTQRTRLRSSGRDQHAGLVIKAAPAACRLAWLTRKRWPHSNRSTGCGRLAVGTSPAERSGQVMPVQCRNGFALGELALCACQAALAGSR